MKEFVLPNRELRSLDLAKLRLANQLREVLILFQELYDIPISEELGYIASTYNNATFQLHVPETLIRAAHETGAALWMELGENYCITLETSPPLSVKLFEHYKFGPICEYFPDCCILENNYQIVFKVKNDDPVLQRQKMALSSIVCYISAYHEQYFQLSSEYLLNHESINGAHFWEAGFIDNEAKIGSLLKEIQTDDRAIGSEVDKFLDIVGLDKLTFCYSERELEADCVKKAPNNKIQFESIEGGFKGFSERFLGISLSQRKNTEDDDI